MAKYGESPFKTVAPRKKTLRIAKKIMSDPDSLTESERKIGNNLLKKLKTEGRTLANYIKLEGKAPPSPTAPKRKPTRPGIAARSAARVEAQRDIDEDVSGRARPVPVIKSPAGPSKRRPTRVEKEDERKKREAARRRQGMQTVLGDVDPSRYKGWVKPKSKPKPKPKPKIVTTTAKPARRGEKKITIKPGQTLSDLAKDKNTTLGAIRKANPGRFPTAASLNKIRAGEKINMPPDVGATTPYDVKTVRVKPRKGKAEPAFGIGDMPFEVTEPQFKAKRVTKPQVKAKRDVREKYPTKGTRRALKPLEGEVRYVNLPEWLGGGRIKVDSSDKALDYGTPEYKHGGGLKKVLYSIKKPKDKPRKAKAKSRKIIRASLRGGRAESRGA